MQNAFDPDNADFTGLREQGGLSISEVIHKTYLNVFEDGCEAAAITEIIVDITSSTDEDKEKIYNMKVNRPFLFLLKNSKLPAGYDLVFMSKIEKFDKFYTMLGQEDEDDEDDENKEKKISNELLIIIIVFGVVLVLSLIGLVIWIKIMAQRRKKKENELLGQLDFL